MSVQAVAKNIKRQLVSIFSKNKDAEMTVRQSEWVDFGFIRSCRLMEDDYCYYLQIQLNLQNPMLAAAFSKTANTNEISSNVLKHTKFFSNVSEPMLNIKFSKGILFLKIPKNTNPIKNDLNVS